MDNRNPTTGISYGNPQFFDRDTLFINSKSKVYLKSQDYESGVKTVSYSVNGASSTYTAPFNILKDVKTYLYYVAVSIFRYPNTFLYRIA